MNLNLSMPPKRLPATRPGMTLIELTVVVLVLITLISILFIGARAWKRGSDRSANMMNLRNTQQAMRSHENLRANPSDYAFTVAILEEYIAMPNPPNAEITYTPSDTITPPGVLWLGPNAPGDIGGEYGPAPGAIDVW